MDSKWLRGTNKIIRSLLISPDHHKLAYLIGNEGEETGVLRFKNLNNLNENYEELEKIFNFAWGSNSKILYYTMTDEQLRPYKVPDKFMILPLKFFTLRKVFTFNFMSKR